MKMYKGFQPGEVHGPAKINKRKTMCRLCPKPHPYTKIYIDSQGIKHRYCLERSNQRRRERKLRPKKQSKLYKGALSWIYNK
jgi:hypothetical protein